MTNQKIIKTFFLAVMLNVGVLNAQAISNFLGHWTGVEDLNSSILSYENHNISIVIDEGGVREGFYIFTSSCEFLFNEDLDWAYHYFGYDKNQSQLIFLRRFITPIGVIGYEELIYDLTEWTNDSFVAEYNSSDNETYHQIRMDIDLMDLFNPIPSKIQLNQNYPNPFNPNTNFDVSVDKMVNGSIVIYNIRGDEVCTLFKGKFESGITNFRWSGNDHNGQSVSSGTYIYRLVIDGKSTISRRMILLK